jgi:hypothetical protein
MVLYTQIGLVSIIINQKLWIKNKNSYMESEKTKQLVGLISKGREEVRNLKVELSKRLSENFYGLTKELFISYPELKSFGWKQYTPYFNDGEACVFSSLHYYPTINGNDENYDESEQAEGEIDIVKLGGKTIYGAGWKKIPNPDYNPYYDEIVSTVKEFLNQFNDDDMKDLFGDHVKIHITEENVVVEDYDEHY